MARAPIRGREPTPPEGTTMQNKKILIRVYYAETHDFSYAFWVGVTFIVNNILLLCGEFKNIVLAKRSLQNRMPNHCIEYIRFIKLQYLQ